MPCRLVVVICWLIFVGFTTAGPLGAGAQDKAAPAQVKRRVTLAVSQGHAHWVNSVAFSPDGEQVLIGSHDHTAGLWDVSSGKEIRSFLGHPSAVFSVAFLPDGKQVLTGSEDTTARLWDMSSGKEIRSFLGHTDHVWSGGP
jgi:WD40 repeat protein